MAAKFTTRHDHLGSAQQWRLLPRIRSLATTAFAIACAIALGPTPARGELATCTAAHPCVSSAEEPVYAQAGIATWYSRPGRRTALGERFAANAMTAAHRTLPFGTIVRVTNLENGRAVKVRINDRGPWGGRNAKRIIDVSRPAAIALGMTRGGVAKIRIEEFLSDQPTG